MADNQVTTDFIANTAPLEAAATAAQAALGKYEKAAAQASSAGATQASATAAAVGGVRIATQSAANATDEYMARVKMANAAAQRGFDTTTGKIDGMAKSIRSMQRALMLGGGLIAGINIIGIGASVARGEFEEAGKAVKELPFGIGQAATQLERLIGWATGMTAETDATNAAIERGNKIIQDRRAILDEIKDKAKAAADATNAIGDRREIAVATADDTQARIRLEQQHAKEQAAAQASLTAAKERAAKLGLDNTPELEAINTQIAGMREVQTIERRNLEASQRERMENAADELDARLAILSVADAEDRKIAEAQQARTNALAEAKQAVINIQLDNQRRGIQNVTAEEQRAQAVVDKTQAVQDAIVEGVKREVEERRKSRAQAEAQAAALLDQKIAAEQMRAQGMEAAAGVYDATAGTRQQIDEAKAGGDTAMAEKLGQLLEAQLQQIVNTANKQAEDARASMGEIVASQRTIQSMSVDEASKQFRMMEVTAQNTKRDTEKQIAAINAVEKKTAEVVDAVRSIKVEGGYGP